MSKIGKKATLFTVILTAILAIALVIGVFFGVNKGAPVDNNKTLTVSMDQIVYETELFDDVKAECEKVFSDAKVSYTVKGEMDGYKSELVYVFDADVDVTAMQNALNARFGELMQEGGAWYGYNIDAMGNAQTTVEFVAKGYVLRAIIAGVVFAILTLAYAWIRFNWNDGLTAMLCVLFSMLLTAAVIVLVRIPVTSSALYAVMLSAFFTAASVLFSLNKLNAARKSDDAANKTSEDLAYSTVAKKPILFLCGTAAIAILLAGALSGVSNLWFAVSSVVGIAIAAFLSLVYAPAVCAALSPVAAAKAAAKDKFAYKGAKKTSTKAKKTSAVAETPVTPEEPVTETPCADCEHVCETQDEVETDAEPDATDEPETDAEPVAEFPEETEEPAEVTEENQD